MRTYILTEGYALRGWKLLPYAIQALRHESTEFFKKPEFELLSACDGHTPIEWDALTQEQREWYERWERGGFIRRSSGRERLRPEQEYRFFPARFKEYVQWSITGRCNYKCRQAQYDRGMCRHRRAGQRLLVHRWRMQRVQYRIFRFAGVQLPPLRQIFGSPDDIKRTAGV